MKILVIDDQQSIRDLLNRYLTNRGHQVELADNGRRGWEIFDSAPDDFDVILTDVMMPEMDGLELLQKVRSQGYEVPVIIMTAHAALEISLKAIRLGAFDFLVKPIKWDLLQSAFSRIETLRATRAEIKEILPSYSSQVQFSIPSRTSFIESLVSFLLTHYAQLSDMYRLDKTRIRVCMIEALTNALVHGNLEISSAVKEKSWEEFNALLRQRESMSEYANREIKVRARFTSEKFEYQVADQGKGFDVSMLPDFRVPESLLLSGRGLLLIHAYMDKVTWNESGNCITMVKYLDT